MPDTPAETPPKLYLTTPIYYVNARPHIGHAYTTIVADVLARRHRLLGHDTFFLTGTDEHGQKIERSALAAGIPPQQFADQVSASFRSLWDRMGITYNDFIRTTEPRHAQGVQHLFKTLEDRGYIYLSTYTGQYCVSDEAYVDGPPGIRCPDCGRLTETVSESNYYFRLSAFQQQLIELIEPDASGEPPLLQIQPDSRRNEVLSFLSGPIRDVVATINIDAQLADAVSGKLDGLMDEAKKRGLLACTATGTPYIPGALKDLSISRTSFKWGIPVPGNEEHVIYVWLDALANYMTALGYGSDDPAKQQQFEKYWPADLHLVGKEIIRFHCVYWPAFLLALNPQLQHSPDEPAPQLSLDDQRGWIRKMLPGAITAHGWLLFDDSKMSKSKGNIVRTETILDAFGTLCPPTSNLRELSPSTAPQEPSSSATHQELSSSAAHQELSPPAATPRKLSSFAEGGGSASSTAPTPHQRDLFASDVLRYFLLREIPFGQDGSFSFEALVTRYNADLANGYGNLVSRTLSMIEKNFAGVLPPISQQTLTEGEPLQAQAETLAQSIHTDFAETQLSRVTTSVASLIGMADGFFSSLAPWKLAKSTEPADRQRLAQTLYTAAEAIRIITALLYPILPFATARVWAQLGLGDIEHAAANGDLKTLTWGGLPPETQLGPLSPIFPRADVSPEKGLAKIMANIEQNPQDLTSVTTQHDASTSVAGDFPEASLTSKPGAPSPSRLSNETTSATPPVPLDPTHPAAPPRTSAIAEPDPIAQVAGSASPTTELHKTPSHTEAFASGPFNTQASTQPVSSAATAPSAGSTPADASPQITIDDFARVELRVARILVCERIPKADKLLRLEVDLGYEKRQILSGIAEFYTPEELIGRKIVVITNLAPRKMRGLESHGMLLAASTGENGKPALATFADADNIEVGARLK